MCSGRRGPRMGACHDVCRLECNRHNNLAFSCLEDATLSLSLSFSTYPLPPPPTPLNHTYSLRISSWQHDTTFVGYSSSIITTWPCLVLKTLLSLSLSQCTRSPDPLIHKYSPKSLSRVTRHDVCRYNSSLITT